ncbi:MAG TPA: hypothetical protein VHF28_05935 [Nitrososphaera sp.]|nr:hypothetical protein [Nitrososphaera sp.]
MSKSSGDNNRNKPPKVGDVDVSLIDDKAGIHSSTDSTRHIERAHEKDVQVTDGKEKGSWQIKEKSES